MESTRWMAVCAGVAMLAASAARAYEAGPVSNGGSISGAVKFKGTPPARAPLDVNKDKEVCGVSPKMASDLVVGPDGGIHWAVVSIAKIDKGKPFATAKTTVDQKGCEYLPHVTLAPAGAEVDILNSDGILHNIHTYGKANPSLNRAQPKFKKTLTEKFEKPDVVKLTCDVHGWMTGYLVVQDHPYYAVTDASGGFKLTDVPPGDYELRVWHEKLAPEGVTQKVSVQGGADAKVNFELAAK